MSYQEPYWARFVKSWKKPPKWIPNPNIKVKKLQHCKACTWPCNYIYEDEYTKSMCPYYNLQ